MNYAKLTNDGLVFAPNPLVIGDMQYFNPITSLLTGEGFKPVEYTDADPPVGYVATCVWNETEDAIVQTWEYEEINFN